MQFPRMILLATMFASADAQPRPVGRTYKRRRGPKKGPTIPCEDLLSGSYLSSRLWTNAPGNCSLSPNDVIEEFERGFAPIIIEAPGFIQYLGAEQLSDADRFARSNFYNVFGTKREAELANEGAKAFVADSNLTGQIVNPSQYPSDGQFTGLIDFWSSTECAATTTGNTGRYLATRLWKSTEVSGQRIINEFRNGFRDEIRHAPGFRMYMGAVVDENTAYFMNVFDTEKEAADANLLAALFIQDSKLADRISLLRATTDLIKFDFFDPAQASGGKEGKGGSGGGWGAPAKKRPSARRAARRSNKRKRAYP